MERAKEGASYTSATERPSGAPREWSRPLVLLLLLLLSCFSHVWLCVTPWTEAHQNPVPGILQARTLEWVAISFSNAWKWKAKVKSLSHREPGKSSNSACRGSLKDQKWLPYHLNPFPKKVPKKFPTKKELAVLGSFVSEYLVHQKQHFRVFVCAWIK